MEVKSSCTSFKLGTLSTQIRLTFKNPVTKTDFEKCVFPLLFQHCFAYFALYIKVPHLLKSPKHSAAITDQNLTSCCWWDVSLPPKHTVGAEKQWSCNIHHQNALKLYNHWSTQSVKPWPISNTSWSHYQGGVKERRNISHHSFVIFSPNLIRNTYSHIK